MSSALLANSGDQTTGISWMLTGEHYLFGEQKDRMSPAPQQESAIFSHLEQEMAALDAEYKAAMDGIRKNYILNDSVCDLLHLHRGLPHLLLEAMPHLRECFGDSTVFILRAPVNEDGSQTLYAVVLWPGDVAEVRHALDKFDDSWWLANSGHAASSLSFTYELV